MKYVISMASARAFLDTAKLDHAIWKNEIYRHIDKREFKHQPSRHTECRLGRWNFDGDGAKYFSHLQDFTSIALPHEEVHLSGAEALQYAAESKYEKMLQNIHRMEEASANVVQQIDHLLVEYLKEG